MYKVYGLLIITIFVFSIISPPVLATNPMTVDEIETNNVILTEQAINNATDNDTWRKKLDPDSQKLYDYIHEITGADNAVTYEIILMFNKQLDSTKKNSFITYIKSDQSTRSKLLQNTMIKEMVGYINTQFSKWSHLSMNEKKALLDTSSHHITGAFELMSNATPMELLWINGYLEQSNNGYTNYNYEMNKLINLGSHASKDDLAKFNKAGDDLADDIIDAHLEYMLANSSSKDNFYTIIINHFLNDTDSIKSKIHGLEKLKEGVDDVDNQLADIQDELITDGGTFVGVGSGMIVFGVALVIGGAIAGGNVVVIGIGIGLIIGGVVLVAMGSPNLSFGYKIRTLRGNMKPQIKDFQDAIDLIINQLKKEAQI